VSEYPYKNTRLIFAVLYLEASLMSHTSRGDAIQYLKHCVSVGSFFYRVRWEQHD
jgi:hypothetical protein